MNLSIKLLDNDYLNYKDFIQPDTKDSISINDEMKNISNLRVFINDNKLYINWEDTKNANWSKNTIMRASSCIPSNQFDGKILETIVEKNKYSNNSFIDDNIFENTLYCYRIFTEFKNSDKIYSGFKNTFFVYVYNSIEQSSSDINNDTIIKAENILLNKTHQFVTNAQIQQWNSYQTNIESMTDNLVNLKIQTNLLEKKINTLQDNLYSEDDDIKNINSIIKSLKNNISIELNNIQGTISDNVANIENINNNISSLTKQLESISNINSDIEIINNNIIKINERLKLYVTKEEFNLKIEDLFSDIRDITIPNTYDFPIVSFIDDDGQNEFLTRTKPIYDKENIKVTLGIITNKVGTDGYMTLDQLKSLNEEGYELISHSKTHDENIFLTNINNQPDSAFDIEFKDSKQWFINNGFGEVDTIVYPYANFDISKKGNTERIKTIAKKYYKNGINADGNYNVCPVDNIYLNRYFIDVANYSFEDMKHTIDEACDKNAWLLIGIHSWSTTQINDDILTKVIEYIKSKNVQILTFKDALKLKGNVISIGDFSNMEKGFFIGRDGTVINKSEKLIFITTDFNMNINYPIDSFRKNKFSIAQVCKENDPLTNSGGILFVYNGDDYFGYEIYLSDYGKKMFCRMWEFNQNKWLDWTDLTEQSLKIVPGIYSGTMNDELIKFDQYKTTIVHLNPDLDTFTHCGGILKIFYGEEYYSYEIFYPLNDNNSYKRSWDSNNKCWSAWCQMNKATGLTYSKEIANNLLNQAFETTSIEYFK